MKAQEKLRKKSYHAKSWRNQHRKLCVPVVVGIRHQQPTLNLPALHVNWTRQRSPKVSLLIISWMEQRGRCVAGYFICCTNNLTQYNCQVTVQLTYDNNETTRPPPRSRPPSPLKQTVSAPSPSTSTFRPKAKVNSSATPLSIARKPTKASNTPSAKFGSLGRTATFSDTSNGSASRANASPTPRARSPVRPPARPASASSLSVQPKSRPTVTRSTLRPPASQSTPGTPDTLYHPTLPSSPNVGLERTRPRHVSVSLHHQVSFSSLNSPAAPSSDLGFMPQHGSNGKSPPNGAPKITAKLSRLAVHDEGSPSPSPSLPASRPNVPRTRAPSMTSTISRSSTAQSSTAPSSSASESVFYPITTATAAANPYRYATARATPTNSRHHYAHPFIAPHDDVNVNYTRGGSPARVDPSLIPLPPNSPPTSALSFSSRSSVSQSSASYAESGDSQSSPPTQHNGMTGKFNSALESLVQISSSVSPREDSFSGTSGNDRDSTSGLDTSERKVKAEAKSNRKVCEGKPNR